MNCPDCQAVNPENARFCMNCGRPLIPAGGSDAAFGGETPARGGPAFNLDQYLPRALLSKLQAARARGAMAGERRVITMLFCDVKGSTAAAEVIDPEIWAEVINGVFERMIRPIYQYEGLVPRLMGDAILAFFGAPIAHEDDPRRAVLAGLAIQSGIRPYAEQMRLEHGIEFSLRIGIHTGLVVVGEIGSDLRLEYTAIGDAINLAARMEQTAEPGAVQISTETYKLVAPFFECEALGEIEVKGKAAPVKAYRVLREKEKPGQLRGLEGLSSPLVGREEQLSTLQDRLQELAKGTGAFVAVIGEAGLGKSTLIAELRKSRLASGLNWLRGDALSYASSIGYFPWQQLIRGSLGVHEGDSPSDVRLRLFYACENNGVAGAHLPFLETLLVVESQESLKTVTGYQGEALVERLTQAVRDYLCGLARQRPLVLVLDDLHWADEASLSLLLSLSDLAGQHPFLFICMLRPDKEAASWDFLHKIQQALGESYHSLDLEPLPAAQTALLLVNLLGLKDLPGSLRALIVEKAQGNPFFVEELIRSLIETGQLLRENNLWRLASLDADLTLPDTLRGVLNARIDRLPDASRHVLQSAAVIGRSFDLRLLERLAALNGALDPQVQSLQASGLIEPHSEGYIFRHVLIQEAAYDSILLKKRAALHLQIGETLEERYADRLEEFAPLLARHFYHAHDARSLHYDLLAGEKAARLYANSEAALHFSRALEVAKRNNAGSEQLGDLYARLGKVYELSGRFEGALANYEEMQSFGLRRGERSIELAALMAKSTIYATFTSAHNPALGESTLKQALQLAEVIQDQAAQAKLHWNLMLTYLFSNRLDQALEHSEPALSLARQVGQPEQLAFALNDAGRLYQARGDFDKAITTLEEARMLWRQQENQVMLADNFGSASTTYLFAGNYDQTLKLAAQALKISSETENYWGQSYSRMAMTFVHLERGELDLAIRDAAECVRLGEQGGLIASAVAMRADLGWLYGCYGDPQRGRELALLALATANSSLPDWKPIPVSVLVRLHLLEGGLSAAQELARETPLMPVSIPFFPYHIQIAVAAAELSMAENYPEKAVEQLEELFKLLPSSVRFNIPEALYTQALALLQLKRTGQAYQTLQDARQRAEGLGARRMLWQIYSLLAEMEAERGQAAQANAFRHQARRAVNEIAERLQSVGLHESFLNQPRVQALLR